MVAQLREPAKPLAMLIVPPAPPRVCTPRPDGFRLNRKTDEFELTPSGMEAAAISQRMLLRYALGYESRAEVGARYCFAARHTQSVINGTTYRWLTAPIRDRLLANGIGNPRMNRTVRGGRAIEIRRALERLAARAAEILRDPSQTATEEAQIVATDLFLLSGAWREDEGQ